MTTVRAQVAAALKPLLPKSWRIVPYTDNLDTVHDVTLMIRQTTVEKSPSNPQGSLSITLVLTVIDPHTDSMRAEDALDDEVTELIFAMRGITNIIWDRADRVVFGEQNHAYDITIHTNVKQEEG